MHSFWNPETHVSGEHGLLPLAARGRCRSSAGGAPGAPSLRHDRPGARRDAAAQHVDSISHVLHRYVCICAVRVLWRHRAIMRSHSCSREQHIRIVCSASGMLRVIVSTCACPPLLWLLLVNVLSAPRAALRRLAIHGSCLLSVACQPLWLAAESTVVDCGHDRRESEWRTPLRTPFQRSGAPQSGRSRSCGRFRYFWPVVYCLEARYN